MIIVSGCGLLLTAITTYYYVRVKCFLKRSSAAGGHGSNQRPARRAFGRRALPAPETRNGQISSLKRFFGWKPAPGLDGHHGTPMGPITRGISRIRPKRPSVQAASHPYGPQERLPALPAPPPVYTPHPHDPFPLPMYVPPAGEAPPPGYDGHREDPQYWSEDEDEARYAAQRDGGWGGMTVAEAELAIATAGLAASSAELAVAAAGLTSAAASWGYLYHNAETDVHAPARELVREFGQRFGSPMRRLPNEVELDYWSDDTASRASISSSSSRSSAGSARYEGRDMEPRP